MAVQCVKRDDHREDLLIMFDDGSERLVKYEDPDPGFGGYWFAVEKSNGHRTVFEIVGWDGHMIAREWSHTLYDIRREEPRRMRTRCRI
jgi:hypothetical protein